MVREYRAEWSKFPYSTFTTSNRDELETFLADIKAMRYHVYKIDIIYTPEIIDEFINK